MSVPVKAYYERLAPDYDRSRFSGSYGRFLHRRERDLLARLLPPPPAHVLDLACGTGRFLDFADTGLDLSPAMLAEARRKQPGKTLVEASATATGLAAESFDAAFSLHLFMHLPKADLAAVLAETRRVLRPGGRFVFDVPSAARRRFFPVRSADWHGATAFQTTEIEALARAGGWRLRSRHGLLFLPVQRFAARWRGAVSGLDRALGETPGLRDFSAYLLFCLEKI